MPFKDNWEKTQAYAQLDSSTLEVILKEARIDQSLCTPIPRGCANLNFLIKGNLKQILRIYLRDGKAPYREQCIAQLVRPEVPAPQVLSIGQVAGHTYALVEYLPGITLRDLILNHPEEPYENAVYQAGKWIGKIQSHRFERNGFLDETLSLSPISADDYLTFAHACLAHPTVIDQLGSAKLHELERFITASAAFFPGPQCNHLVHGDYGPENLLVQKIDDEWRISGVLDWEFAWSGHWICDVKNMLRYANEIEPKFEEAFLKGITDAGLILPDQWRLVVDLMNTLALLDCLVRADPKLHPNACSDIDRLLFRILERS